MPASTAIFNIVQGATAPFVNFELDGVEAGDFTSITLEITRSDSIRLTPKVAVIDDPGVVTQNIPLSFHFEWDPGDTDVVGNYHADLVLEITPGLDLKIPERNALLIVVREKA